MCIYLARHGQDHDNVNYILNGRRDLALTERGIEQAKEVSLKIKNSNIKIDKIYTSPLQRAVKTAEIISGTIGSIQPEVLYDLIERDYGIMTGKSRDLIEEICAPDILKTEFVTYFLSPPNAETFPQLIERSKRLLSFIEEQHKNGEVLLVSHGDIGKMIYCAYYNLDWKEVLKMFHFGNSEVLVLCPENTGKDVKMIQIEQQYKFS